MTNNKLKDLGSEKLIWKRKLYKILTIVFGIVGAFGLFDRVVKYITGENSRLFSAYMPLIVFLASFSLNSNKLIEN